MNTFDGDSGIPEAEEFDGKITGHVLSGGVYYYQWSEVDPTDFSILANGRTGDYNPTGPTGQSPTYELNNRLVLNDTFIRLSLRSVINGDTNYSFQASGTVYGTGVAKHVPRWNSAGDGIEETAVTIGSAGFSTVDSAVFIPYPASSIVSTTPFILLDPEVSFYGTSSQVSQLRINLATNGIGTGIRVLAESDYPFTSSSFLLNSVESCWSMSLSGDSAHGHANFSAAVPASASNMLSANVYSIWLGHNDTTRSDLPTAAAGAYFTYTHSGTDYTVNLVIPLGAGGVGHFQINGTDLISGTGITAGSIP